VSAHLPDPVTVQFECGHRFAVARDEYGDGSAWCPACEQFRCYERCKTCASLDCQSMHGPTLPHEDVAVWGVLGEPPA
jgi:hypothetical protein